MKKSFFVFVADLCAVTAAVIGAGFATGQEILLYFKNANPFVAAACCFALFFVFLRAGTEFGAYLCEEKKSAKLFNVFYKASVAVSCFVVLCAMAGGAQTNADIVAGKSGGVPFAKLFTLLFCMIFCCFDFKNQKKVYFILAPVMVGGILAVCFADKNFDFSGTVAKGAVNSLFYVSLNTVSLAGILCDLSKNYSKKQKNVFCLACGAILSTLIFLIIAKVNASESKIAPLVDLAAKNAVRGKTYGVVVTASIMTTMCASAYPLIRELNAKIKNRFVCSLTVFCAAFAASFAGFKNIVNYLYPLVSAVGIFFAAYFAFDCIKNAKRSQVKATKCEFEKT